ncbi:MAG TPA: hypothetical protein ENN51_06805 [candidate division WOR-3 bacterium]|uniref:Uncharacterized protein n=1 Tax=candidate division WOR-3 bacterium TaxID=2052148 RepID=A0A7V0T6A7_UNCW3|nr:hypothetical protein [candidate division WOR-3 bacterium]
MRLLVIVMMFPALTLAGFTLGGPEPPTMTIGGQVRFGPALSLDPDPWEVGFENSSASLFFTGRLAGRLDWMVHPSMAGGRFALLECFGEWKPLDLLGVRFGHQKASFGRVHNSSAARLLFAARNPLAAFAPGYQLGVTPTVNMPDGRAAFRFGAYNGTGWGAPHADPWLMYAASLEVTPLGPVPYEESAHRGYETPVFALIPGVWTHRERRAVGVPPVQREYTTTVAGIHAALRADYLALDAVFCRRWVETEVGNGAEVVITDGLSVQGGYAFDGRYEPIARFTMVGLEGAITTLEAGFNWYFGSYASRLGLNFAGVLDGGDGARHDLRLYYEFQF